VVLARADKKHLTLHDRQLVGEHELVLEVLKENEELEYVADKYAGQLNAISDEFDDAPDYPSGLDDFLHEIRKLRAAAVGYENEVIGVYENEVIGVYEHEVIKAIEMNMDPQGDEARHIHKALADASSIIRGKPTSDGRIAEPCPQCRQTYGFHKFSCSNQPNTQLRLAMRGVPDYEETVQEEADRETDCGEDNQ